jgi:hypothetical protein
MPRDRLRTLYLHANGSGSTIVFVDTVLRGVLRYRDGDLPPSFLRRYSTVNLLFAELRDLSARLSYISDWRDAFLRSKRLDVEVCNINNLVDFGRRLLTIGRYDLIVVSHSAAGDDMNILSRAAPFFRRRRGKLVVFIGNEYDLFAEKIAFMRDTDADFICTQLPNAAARYLYDECAQAKLVEMPHALNPEHYRVIEGADRNTEIGFIGDIYWPFIGDRERTNFIEWFEKNGQQMGLRCDIRKQRVAREDWNIFLNGCHGIIGAESGTYYLNERGQVLDRARAYNLLTNQAASFDEVYERFFRDQPRGVSGKAVSSRHFEPIGARACQILLEGHYNGILLPDEHYIPVKRDLSDIKDAIAKFRDASFRQKVVNTAYEYVMDSHTYDHRVAYLLSQID